MHTRLTWCLLVAIWAAVTFGQSPPSTTDQKTPAESGPSAAKPDSSGNPEVKNEGKTVLAAGTVVRLRTTQSIDSKHAKTGDPLAMEVMHDVKAGDLLVIAKHTPVTATLARVQRASRGLRRGSLLLEVKAINDISGRPIAVGGGRSQKPSPDRQIDAYTQTVLSMGFFAPTLLFFRGDEAELPRGDEIDAQVSQDVALNPDELRPRMAAIEAEEAAARERSRTGQATVHFYFRSPSILQPSRKEGIGGATLSESRPMPEDHMVLVDGQKLVRLRNWHFYDAQIAPGHHVVACHGHTVELEAKADEQYYVRVLKGKASIWTNSTPVLPELRDPETGEDEIYPLLPTDKKDVYAPQR